MRSRQFAALSIALIAAVALLTAGFLFYGNLTPTTPNEVVVIIANGASENASLGFEPFKITIVIGGQQYRGLEERGLGRAYGHK